jgi:hypothetical protein
VLEGRSKNGFLGYGLTAVGEIGFKAPFFLFYRALENTSGAALLMTQYY